MNFYKNIMLQVVGGIVAGLIGFFSAWGMLKVGEWRDNNRMSKELLDKLYVELSKDWFSLAMDIRKGEVGYHKLSNQCWNIDIISKVDSEDADLTGTVECLYKEIESFNYLCDMRATSRLYGLEAQQIIDLLKKNDYEMPSSLLEKIKQVKALIFAELIRRNKRKETDWNDEGFDFRTAESPYLIEKKNEEN